MRIVMFIGSPLDIDKAEMEKLAKRLKKEKVNVDIVSYGDHQKNNDILTAFINTLNGKDGTGSHLVSVPRGSQLQEALISSPIIQGEDGMGAGGLGGAGFEFGVDPNEDPELALALRVSMEEQRQRQEEEQRRAQAESAQDTEGSVAPATAASTVAPTSDEAMLERALALSTETPVKRFRVNLITLMFCIYRIYLCLILGGSNYFLSNLFEISKVPAIYLLFSPLSVNDLFHLVG